MCITAPGRIVEVVEGVALVETDGRRRRASLVLVPEARPGDWVIVGSGAVLRRLDPAEAADIRASIATAQGGPR